jgi:hypothetical protein
VSSACAFDPFDSSRIAISGSRDIRLFDTSRSSKSLHTISGAVAQAFPLSFTFHPFLPHVVISGWELASASPYIRVVDLREGGAKSVEIWKAKHVRGLSCSEVDDRCFSGFDSSDSTVALFDMRKIGSKTHSPGTFQTKEFQKVERIKWSTTKRNTIGIFSSDGELFTWRNDTDKVRSVTNNCLDFCWNTNNEIISLTNDPSPGSLVVCDSRTASPFPTVHLMGSKNYSSQAIQLEERIQKGMSLSAPVESDPFLADQIDWADNIDDLPELHARISEAILGTEDVTGSTPPIHVTTGREWVITRLLIPKKISELIFSLLSFNFEPLLRKLIKEKTVLTDPLIPALTEYVLSDDNKSSWSGFENISIDENLDLNASYVNSAVQIVNRVWGKSAIDVALFRDESLNVFVRAAGALMYLPSVDWNLFASECMQSETSLRAIVFVDSKDAIEQIVLNHLSTHSYNPIPVSLLSISLGTELARGKCMHAVLELCNAKKLWSLRAHLSRPSTPVSGTSIVCYYCSKPLTGFDQQFPTDSTGEMIINRCPHRGCHKSLPSCCVCLESIKISLTPSVAVVADEWVVFCGTCRHGGHKSHLLDWFKNFDECPVAGCNCQCTNVDGCE